MKSAAIVFGMHRSGTSVLSRILTEIGFAQAQEVIAPDANNPLGFWEPKAIVALNDTILKESGSWWADPAPYFFGNGAPNMSLKVPPDFIEQFAGQARAALDLGYANKQRICIKDPRLCLLWSLWRKVLAEAGYAVHGFYIYRHPFAVAQSLRRRNQLETATSLRLWLRYTLAILAGRQNVDSIRAIDFADLHQSPKQVLTSLIGHCTRVAGTSNDIDPADIVGLVQSDHVHHHWPHDWEAGDKSTPLFSLVADVDRQARNFTKTGTVEVPAVKKAHASFYKLSRRDNIINPLSRPYVDDMPVVTAARQAENAKRQTTAARCPTNKPLIQLPKERRAVVFHYHLFKNAGTSVDAILRHNFGPYWLAGEFEPPNEDIDKHRAKVRAWILDNPDIFAFSSHTALLPEPEIDGIKVLPIIFLRHPIDRIFSAYHFERRQQADTFGAKLAKEGDFAHYVRKLLDDPDNFAIKDFQSRRLAGGRPRHSKDLDAQTRTSLNRLPFIGLVDQFDASVQTLQQWLRRDFPDFAVTDVKLNIGALPETNLDERLQIIESLLPANLFKALTDRNKLDFYCYERLRHSYTSKAITT